MSKEEGAGGGGGGSGGGDGGGGLEAAGTKNGQEKTFHLDAAFVLSQKKHIGKKKWEEEGKKVELPSNQGYTKIVVDLKAEKDVWRLSKLLAEESSAEEIEMLVLNGNPVMEVEGAEKLVGVKTVCGEDAGFTSFPPWIVRLPKLGALYFRDNDVPEIPPSFFAMNTLTYVDLVQHCSLSGYVTTYSYVFLGGSDCCSKTPEHTKLQPTCPATLFPAAVLCRYDAAVLPLPVLSNRLLAYSQNSLLLAPPHPPPPPHQRRPSESRPSSSSSA